MMNIKDEIAVLIQKTRYDFRDLETITRILRSEEGCPWDREQDHHSIRGSMIEETYEVVEAIDTENPVLLREELGDVLFQVMFHSQIEAEKSCFDVSDVVDDICKKMIHRHPHVFGNVQAESSAEVLQNWEQIKTEEKQRNTLVDKLRAIPPMLPALMRAAKVSKKAEAGQTANASDFIHDLQEQLNALTSKLQEPQFDATHEIGALLMGITRLSRLLDVDTELALTQETDRLIEEVAKNNI